MTDTDSDVAKVAKLTKDIRIGMMTTVGPDGHFVSRPMAQQEVEFDGDLWFFAYADSDLVAQVRTHPQVNVSFSDDKQHAWVSIAGTARQLDDRAKAEELWNPMLKAWFPDGLETPTLTLIKVHADTAEYWESAHSSRVVTLLGYAKAAVTGRTPDAGENETVQL